MVESFSEVFLSDKFLHFLDIEVAFLLVITVPILQLNSNDFKNLGQALIIQNSIGILSVFAQFFHSNFLRLTIFRL